MKIVKILSAIAFALVSAMVISVATDIHPLWVAGPLVSYGLAGVFGFIPMPANSLCVNFGAIANPTFPDIDGREAMGGYTSIAYIALKSDIATWPTQPDIETVTKVGDLAKLLGAFVMKEGKYFIKVMVKPGTSQFTPEGQGEVGGKSFKPKGQFFLPGIDDETMGLSRLLNNKFGVVILPDPDGNHRICVGTEELPAEFKPTGESGQKAADVKGFTYAFEADSFAPGWIYEGAIPLSGGSVVGVS
jgi:hypothetical protein